MRRLVPLSRNYVKYEAAVSYKLKAGESKGKKLTK